MSGWTFLREFARSPRMVGALAPSSAALAAIVVGPLDSGRASRVIEFGPGTGAFTRVLAHRLSPGSRYLGIERSGRFHADLVAEFPTFEFVRGDVGDLEAILDAHGFDQVDAIVSGLPWASLPRGELDRVFPAIGRRLAPDGWMTTFAYVHALWMPGARALQTRLHACFEAVQITPPVWSNVPPAVCYIARRPRRPAC